MVRAPLGISERLAGVRYEIRGPLARRAHELELLGYEIIYLNIGNPGRFGFRTPESMRQALIENLPESEPYCHQKGIFPAREAIVMQQQNRGVTDVTADEVFLGNGVSELIDLTLRALLNADDEVLVPSPGLSALDRRGHSEWWQCRSLSLFSRKKLCSTNRRYQGAGNGENKGHCRHQSQQSNGSMLPQGNH